ncbi:MAG: alpha-L-fucosidase, partial [Verrucomicrobia bacterium]|nr:alpha-L-fucosidase [Verrucomicrobiota bacterium]
MKIKARGILGTWVAAVVLAAEALAVQGPYTPQWASVQKHRAAPDWFLDAKFGIYFHWGVYSVPAFGSEWYPRNMYNIRSQVYRHHLATYGDPAKFGYPDFVPMFKAEKFDPEAWARLFQEAGARFAGPVAEHHDGFSMWASKQTPWNAADMGPKRDIVGMLEKAIRARGMRFITTFHHARNSLWLKNGKWTGHYEFVKRYFPQLLEDPQRSIMYGYMPREKFLKMWLGKLQEVVDAYRPDIIWFDSWLDEIPENYRLQFLAHYLNSAARWGKEVVVTCKQLDLPREVAVEDYEKGRANRLTPFPWLTDDTISRGSWCYTQNLRIKPPEEVLHSFIDIVSKNGVLLLNISPKADGTIPENQKHVLREMGAWLRVCGEAVYNTRPWKIFGEGPTRLQRGGAFIRWNGRYTARDIRFTRSKDGRSVYAIALGWPEGNLTLASVRVEAVRPGASVRLLGYEKPLSFQVNRRKQLVINMPALEEAARPCRHAYAFKLTGLELSAQSDFAEAAGAAVALTVDKATLEGSLALETRAGASNVGYWDNPSDKVHWLAKIPRPGTYRVRGKFALPQGASNLRLRVGDQTLR